MKQAEAFKAVAAAYRQAYTKYRGDDEIEVETPNHRRLGGILAGICISFQRPIKVLDVGCGTGRYFHCLKDVSSLVGLDLSPEMLQAAETPVRRAEVRIGSIELRCGNIYEVEFGPGSFDFIYSLGMFGFGCPVTVELCNRFFEWLAPGGILFFNAMDFKSLSLADRIRKSLRGLVHSALPESYRRRLAEKPGRIPFCGLREKELVKILRQSRFKEFTVSKSACRSPIWSKAAHLECIARKPGSQQGTTNTQQPMTKNQGPMTN